MHDLFIFVGKPTVLQDDAAGLGASCARAAYL